MKCFPRLLVVLWRPIVPIRKPFPTVLARPLYVDVLPDLSPRARRLDQAGRFAKFGEDEGLVLALKSVCVVLTHGVLTAEKTTNQVRPEDGYNI